MEKTEIKSWMERTGHTSYPIALKESPKEPVDEFCPKSPLRRKLKHGTKFYCNYLGSPILRQKIGILVDVDVGTHGRASLREKILAKTGAKRAFFEQNSG